MTNSRALPAHDRILGMTMRATVRLAIVGGLACTLSGCKTGEDPAAHVAGWSMIEATQKHPILVSKQPANMTVRIARGATGLTPNQRANVVDFLNKYRGGDSNQGKLAINVPSGSPNEVAALHAVADLRQLLSEYGVDETRMNISSYHSDGEPQPPIRISYTKFVAQGPECSHWGRNVATSSQNLPSPNFGCSSQNILAAQIANPADLLGPRTMTPAVGERRDSAWDKFTKGESTITKKDADEKIQVKGGQ